MTTDVDVYRGDSKTASIIIISNADGSAWDPNRPGVTAEWRMATSANSNAQTLARKTLGAGIAFNETGATIELNTTDTDLPSHLYYHEMKLYDGDDVATVVTGILRVRRSLHMGTDLTTETGDILTDESGDPLIQE